MGGSAGGSGCSGPTATGHHISGRKDSGGGGGGLLEPRVYSQKEMEQNRTKQFKPQ